MSLASDHATLGNTVALLVALTIADGVGARRSSRRTSQQRASSEW
jgi:hypothetical protein